MLITPLTGAHHALQALLIQRLDQTRALHAQPDIILVLALQDAFYAPLDDTMKITQNAEDALPIPMQMSLRVFAKIAMQEKFLNLVLLSANPAQLGLTLIAPQRNAYPVLVTQYQQTWQVSASLALRDIDQTDSIRCV